MKSNPDLLKMFQEYNRRYFHGKLPEPNICFSVDMRNKKTGCPAIGRTLGPGILRYRVVDGKTWIPFKTKKPTILISEELRTKQWAGIARQTILHEMAHLAIPKRFNHGPRFQKEMLRLAKAGAFKGLW